MTNNPTIDGVSRDALKKWRRDLDACQRVIWLAGGFDPAYCTDAQECLAQMDSVLDAPAVERQEPVAFRFKLDYEHGNGWRRGAIRFVETLEEVDHEDKSTWRDITPLYEANPEVAALQSTIAQLEDKLKKAIDLDFQRRETIARLEERVQELESGRGEPVAWRGMNSLGEVVTEWVDGSPPEKLFDLCGNEAYYDSVEIAYFRQPSRLAPEKYDEVLLPFLALMRAELHANAHKGDRPGWLQMDSKTAILEVFYHMGKLHQAVHRGEETAIKEYAADVANMCMMLLDVCACLDATAALNGERK